MGLRTATKLLRDTQMVLRSKTVRDIDTPCLVYGFGVYVYKGKIVEFGVASMGLPDAGFLIGFPFTGLAWVGMG